MRFIYYISVFLTGFLTSSSAYHAYLLFKINVFYLSFFYIALFLVNLSCLIRLIYIKKRLGY